MCGSTALWAVTSSARPLYCLDVGRMLLTNSSLHCPPKSTVHYTTKYSHAYAVCSRYVDHTPPDFSSLFPSFFLFFFSLLPSLLSLSILTHLLPVTKHQEDTDGKMPQFNAGTVMVSFRGGGGGIFTPPWNLVIY